MKCTATNASTIVENFYMEPFGDNIYNFSRTYPTRACSTNVLHVSRSIRLEYKYIELLVYPPQLEKSRQKTHDRIAYWTARSSVHPQRNIVYSFVCDCLFVCACDGQKNRLERVSIPNLRIACLRVMYQCVVCAGNNNKHDAHLLFITSCVFEDVYLQCFPER